MRGGDGGEGEHGEGAGEEGVEGVGVFVGASVGVGEAGEGVIEIFLLAVVLMWGSLLVCGFE